MNLLRRWLSVWRWALLMSVGGGILPLFLDLPVLGEGKEGRVFLSTVATVASIITGFTGASIGTLLNSNSSLIEEVKRLGKFPELMRFVGWVLVVAIGLILTAIAGFLSLKTGAAIYGHPMYPHVLFFCIGLLVGMYITMFFFLVNVGVHDGNKVYKKHRPGREAPNTLESGSYHGEASDLINPNLLKQDSYGEEAKELLAGGAEKLAKAPAKE